MKVWDADNHNGWGNKIVTRDYGGDTLYIRGHIINPRVKEGDMLRANGKLYRMDNVDYVGNPCDLFFADGVLCEGD